MGESRAVKAQRSRVPSPLASERDEAALPHKLPPNTSPAAHPWTHLPVCRLGTQGRRLALTHYQRWLLC